LMIANAKTLTSTIPLELSFFMIELINCNQGFFKTIMHSPMPEKSPFSVHPQRSQVYYLHVTSFHIAECASTAPKHSTPDSHYRESSSS
jgi:hypothetical protein